MNNTIVEQNPRSKILSEELTRECVSVYRLGRPGSCSPGKIWIVIALRYREMQLKLDNEVLRYKRSAFLKAQCFY